MRGGRMKVKELKKLVEDSIYPEQRIIVEDNWAVFEDTDNYNSSICDEDEVQYIYIDENNTLHIHIVS